MGSGRIRLEQLHYRQIVERAYGQRDPCSTRCGTTEADGMASRATTSSSVSNCTSSSRHSAKSSRNKGRPMAMALHYRHLRSIGLVMERGILVCAMIWMGNGPWIASSSGCGIEREGSSPDTAHGTGPTRTLVHQHIGRRGLRGGRRSFVVDNRQVPTVQRTPVVGPIDPSIQYENGEVKGVYDA